MQSPLHIGTYAPAGEIVWYTSRSLDEPDRISPRCAAENARQEPPWSSASSSSDGRPDVESARDYFSECLRLTELSESLGYTNVRTVEHYFHPYWGYSPNPVAFLAAAAARTTSRCLITGAVR